MTRVFRRITAVLVLMSLGAGAQAGHLFSQAGNGSTPVNLTAGNGIDIPVTAPTSSSNTDRFDLYLSGFDSGDVLAVGIAGQVRTFDFDSMPSGYSATSVQITGNPISTNDPALFNNLVFPGAPFTWRIAAVAGDFNVAGFVIGNATQSIIGTDITTTITQASVNPGGVSGGPPPPSPSSPSAIPVLTPIHLVLLILGLIGIAATRRPRSR